jgi:hypothetical protein
MSAQIAVAAEKDQGSAEGATAAAQYKAWNASKDPKAIVAGEQARQERFENAPERPAGIACIR